MKINNRIYEQLIYDYRISKVQTQANCFEAYRRVFEKQSWIWGFSVFGISEQSADKRYYPSEESTKLYIK